MLAGPSIFSNKVANLQSQSPMTFFRQTPMEDTISQKNNKQNKQDSDKQSSKNEVPDIPSSRQEQHLLLYVLNLLLTFCISFQNIPLVFSNNEISKAYMSVGIVLVTLFVSLITTYKLCQDWWKIFNLYLLLDNIFLAQVASSFGFVGFLLVIYTGNWYQVFTMMAFPLEIIFVVGNFRVLMLLVKWSKLRVILFKLVLLADSAVFFEIGAYYMSVNYQYSGGSNTTLDGKVKDFVLLYIFGLFALFVEMYAKMCEIDQTNQLKFEYQLKQMEESKKIQRIRRSVIGMNLEVEKVRSRFMEEAKKPRASYLEVEEIKREQL